MLKPYGFTDRVQNPAQKQFSQVVDVVIPGSRADNGHDDGNKNRNNIVAD